MLSRETETGLAPVVEKVHEYFVELGKCGYVGFVSASNAFVVVL